MVHSKKNSKFYLLCFKVLATDLNGKKVFLTRYICDQIPPSDFGFDPTNPSPNSMVLL